MISTTLDQTAARALTDEINALVEDAWHLIVQAFQERAWAALGYSTWDDYCTAEFAGARLRLPRENRQEIVVSLREAGMSTRAIASATGLGKGTIGRDLEPSAPNGAVETVTGVNGKHYQPTRTTPPDDDPIFAPGELEAIDNALRAEHGDDLTPEHLEQAIADNLESKHVPRPAPELRPLPDLKAAELEERDSYPVPKPDLGGGVSHPARYSAELVPLFVELLDAYSPGDRVLDPFAGTGRIHELLEHGYQTTGIELEPEWAHLHPRTIVGNALELPQDDESVDAVVTSPTYGNRLADSHNAADPERRRSYTHDLGRPLHEDNTGALHWRTTAAGTAGAGSADYRAMHLDAWREAVRVLRPGGVFVLNCCDHVREGIVQTVTAWHAWALGHLDLEYLEARSVPTRKLRQGAHADLREQEAVLVFRKPAP